MPKNILPSDLGLLKFEPKWPKITIGGNVELKECVKDFSVGLGGSVYLKLMPLIGAEIRTDIIEVAASRIPGLLNLKRKLADKSRRNRGELELLLIMGGEIAAEMKWEKSAQDKWLSTAGDKKAEASLKLTIKLEARAVIQLGFGVGIFRVDAIVGAEFHMSGARDINEGIGVIASIYATTADNKPAIGGTIAFTGLTIYYIYYAETGVMEDKSDDKAPPTGRGKVKIGASEIPKNSKTALRFADAKKYDVFEFSEWCPGANKQRSTPTSLDKIKI